MTQSAAAAIRRVIAEARDPEILGIRIAVCVGGCAGLRYEMGLEAEARKGDAVVHFGDVMVFVDEESKSWLAGAEVDFCDGPAKGFVFNNPNTRGRCSCGSNPGVGRPC